MIYVIVVAVASGAVAATVLPSSWLLKHYVTSFHGGHLNNEGHSVKPELQ